MFASFPAVLLAAMGLAMLGWSLLRPHLGEMPTAPAGDTPEELIAALQRAWPKPGSPAPAWIDQRLTGIGRELWKSMAPYPPSSGPVATLWAGVRADGHYEIHHLAQTAHGGERLAWIFFKEHGAWRMHDVYIFTLRDVRWDMHLSLVQRDPAEAAGRLAVQNPGTAWEVSVGNPRQPSTSDLLPAIRAMRLPSP